MKNIVLLLASLFFYAWGEPVYVILMILSILFNYFCGRDIKAKEDDPRRAKFAVIFAIAGNLLILGFFKYFGFLMETVNAVLPVDIPYRELALPVGISFLYISGNFLYSGCLLEKGGSPEEHPVFCLIYQYVPAADRRTDCEIC